MQKSVFPGYTIGVDAYDDIKMFARLMAKRWQ